jgi:hypothetical protein
VTLEATLAAATFPTKFEEFKFERPDALPINNPPNRVVILAVVITLRFDVSKLETAPFAALRKPVFEVLVLSTLKKAVLAPRPPVTLAVVNHAFAILATPDTLREFRMPKLVIFDWVFESWREVSGFTRFEALTLDNPEPFPMYN